MERKEKTCSCWLGMTKNFLNNIWSSWLKKQNISKNSKQACQLSIPYIERIMQSLTLVYRIATHNKKNHPINQREDKSVGKKDKIYAEYKCRSNNGV